MSLLPLRSLSAASCQAGTSNLYTHINLILYVVRIIILHNLWRYIRRLLPKNSSNVCHVANMDKSPHTTLLVSISNTGCIYKYLMSSLRFLWCDGFLRSKLEILCWVPTQSNCYWTEQMCWSIIFFSIDNFKKKKTSFKARSFSFQLRQQIEETKKSVP